MASLRSGGQARRPVLLSPGILALEDFRHGAEEDGTVQRDAALAYEPQIQPAALGVGQPATPRNLPQARESRLGLQDFGGVRAVMEAESASGDGPRPHQRH